MKGLRTINLTDADVGELPLLVVVPRPGNPWGVLAPLKDTLWGEQIDVVSGEAMSQALHGYALPLARELGVRPRYRGRRITDSEGICAEINSCVNASPACRPGEKALPDCYEAPKLEGDARLLAARVALAWRSERYVVVVVGEEFSLR